MKLIVGLGNPGKEYEGTRHNVGFSVIDQLVSDFSCTGPKKKFNGQVYEGMIANEKVLFLKPSTYMNKSGSSVSQAVKMYKFDPSDIIVIYDELDLPVGKLRVKQGGGAGGHNGIKSLDSHIDKNYHRVRIGIDHPGDSKKVASYVLKPFAKKDQPIVDDITNAISRYIDKMIEGDSAGFMNAVSLYMQPTK